MKSTSTFGTNYISKLLRYTQEQVMTVSGKVIILIAKLLSVVSTLRNNFTTLKQFIIFIPLLLFVTSSHADDFKRYVMWAVQSESYSEISHRLDSLEDQSDDRITYSERWVMGREIVEDHKACIREVREAVIDKDNPAVSTIHSYTIRLIRNKDQICHIIMVREVISGSGDNRKTKELVVYKNVYEDRFNYMKSVFESVYRSPMDFEGIYRTDIVYGTNCGFGGMYVPDEWKQMNEFVENRDTESLKKWLCSTVIEVQLFAVEGLLKLQRDGVELDEFTLYLIDYIGDKEGSASTCSGCIFLPRSISGIVEGLKEEYEG